MALLLSSMLIPFLFTIGCLNYLLLEMSTMQYGLQSQMPYDNFAIAMKINFFMLLIFPPIFIVILIIGAFLSNSFVGPFKRIEREINAIAESGDIEKRLSVRKNDAIRPLIGSINNLLDNISKKCKT